MVLHFFKSGYTKVREALGKTRETLGQKLYSFFSSPLDISKLEQLEEILYEADLGVKAASVLTKKVQEVYKSRPTLTGQDLLEIVKDEILSMIASPARELAVASPAIILVVGVNGNGKTTSTAKLAQYLCKKDKKVLVGAVDTFRAAATEQLQIWAEKLQIEMVKGQAGSDPAAIAFDAVTAASARGYDAAILDTAGRLHTKAPLMKELEKIRRSCAKALPGAPHETLLVLDATTGQNAIEQAKIFHQSTPISGLILTKLDGTSKGGMVVSIQQELNIPVKFIGVGEGIDDLLPFDPAGYVQALFEKEG